MSALFYLVIGTSIHFYRFGYEKALEEWDVFVSYVLVPTLVAGLAIYLYNLLALPAKMDADKSQSINDLENEITRLTAPGIELFFNEDDIRCYYQMDDMVDIGIGVRCIGGGRALKVKVELENVLPFEWSEGRIPLRFINDESKGWPESKNGRDVINGVDEFVKVARKNIKQRHFEIMVASDLQRTFPANRTYQLYFVAYGENVKPCFVEAELDADQFGKPTFSARTYERGGSA